MYNLQMSAKLTLFAKECKSKIMMHGVTRAKDRGIPRCIYQAEEKRKEGILSKSGTLKVATLKNDKLVALSLYNTKPFHFMTNFCEKIEWKRIRSRFFTFVVIFLLLELDHHTVVIVVV